MKRKSTRFVFSGCKVRPYVDSLLPSTQLASIEADDVTVDGTEQHDARAPHRHRDSAGRVFEPILLSAVEHGQERVTAVLVLHAELRKAEPGERQLLQLMALHLTEHGDVQGVVIEAPESVTKG